MKKYYNGFCDMNSGKPLEAGHIVAVRYVWSSYVGQVSMVCGHYLLHSTGANRHSFLSAHTLKNIHTYQIIGHVNKGHIDYNEDAYLWYMSEEMKCPFELTIYQNCDNDETKK